MLITDLIRSCGGGGGGDGGGSYGSGGDGSGDGGDRGDSCSGGGIGGADDGGGSYNARYLVCLISQSHILIDRVPGFLSPPPPSFPRFWT